jgi:hypothetical protein
MTDHLGEIDHIVVLGSATIPRWSRCQPTR